MRIKFIISIHIIVFCSLNLVTSQSTPTDIFYKDGKSFSGYGSINTKKGSVKFRTSKNRKGLEVSFDLLDSVVQYIKKDSFKYQLVQVKEIEEPMILELLVDGDTKLFAKSTYIDNNGIVSGGGYRRSNNRFLQGRVAHGSTDFFIQKKDSLEADYFWLGNPLTTGFKVVASDYFKDCPSLSKKILEKEFRSKHMIEIIEYYNNECN